MAKRPLARLVEPMRAQATYSPAFTGWKISPRQDAISRPTRKTSFRSRVAMLALEIVIFPSLVAASPFSPAAGRAD